MSGFLSTLQEGIQNTFGSLFNQSAPGASGGAPPTAAPGSPAAQIQPESGGLLDTAAYWLKWITTLGSFLPDKWGGQTMNHAKSYQEGFAALAEMFRKGINEESVGNLLIAGEQYYVRDMLSSWGVPGPAAQALTVAITSVTKLLVEGFSEAIKDPKGPLQHIRDMKVEDALARVKTQVVDPLLHTTPIPTPAGQTPAAAAGMK